MQKGKRMSKVIVTVYVSRNEKSKTLEKFLKEYSVPYVKHEEPMPKYDKKYTRPYVTIGDPKGTPLGPTSNLSGIESTIKRLFNSSE
jgi:hypothetical protein